MIGPAEEVRKTYSAVYLIDQHGGDTKLPDLRGSLVGDCDKANGMDYERCNIFFPQLRDLMAS